MSLFDSKRVAGIERSLVYATGISTSVLQNTQLYVRPRERSSVRRRRFASHDLFWLLGASNDSQRAVRKPSSFLPIFMAETVQLVRFG